MAVGGSRDWAGVSWECWRVLGPTRSCSKKGKNMTLTVEWIPSSKEVELVVPPPKPAKNYIPEWYKQSSSSATDKSFEFQASGIVKNLSLKSCMPFLDALTHGYIQETWTDIHFKSDRNNEYILEYNYSAGPQILDCRDPKLHTGFRMPEGYYKNEFVWKEPWVPRLPKGYSMLYTSPLNNFNLPFTPLSGIIDSDLYHHEYGGQNPFILKKDFEGTLPVGTPMYLMIPVKRESWDSAVLPFNYEENFKRLHALRKHLANSYKKNFWQKKQFN
jgi:hypothetical protein